MFGKSDRLGQNAATGKAMAERVTEDGESVSGVITDVFGGEESIANDNDAQVRNSAMQAVSLVVALVVGAIITAFLIPIGIEELSQATLGENASDGAQAIWGILDVIIILAVFLFFVSVALGGADRL